MGASVGAAMVGTRPIVEMRFSDFALCAVDELVNQAAKARYMFGGQARVPMVIREPIGIWRSSAAQHSQSLESWYTHIPGLVVVAPATPADNKGLLKSAIRSDDPVVYMEHKNLWGTAGEVPEDDGWTLPLGAARVEREGGDVTIVSWSRMVQTCALAAAALADEGTSAEVIDLRTLWPWDRERVLGFGREDRSAPRRPRGGGGGRIRGRGGRDGGRGAGGAGASSRGAPHSDPLCSPARGSGHGSPRK